MEPHAFLSSPCHSDNHARTSPRTSEVNVDDEIKEAIGQFVDNFDFALAIFIMQSPSGCERDSKLSTALVHATNYLSRKSMTEGKVQSFWRPFFRRALPSIKLASFRNKFPMDYPIIPTDINHLEFPEWNPSTSSSLKIDSRKLLATILDCMLIASQYL